MYRGEKMSAEHSGSCLCGEVKYKIIGEPQRFYHCHCQRCRKSTGTGHCSNIFIATESIAWLSGENQRRSFKVPDAERFTRHFCNNCGSPLPAHLPSGDLAIVPAGSLDTDPNFQPQARIFQDSRADWSCESDIIPCFDQYPE